MRGKKIYIVLITIILVFFLIMFALFGVDNIKKGRYNTTLIIGNDTVWAYKKKRWINLSNSSYVRDLNWKKFNVFINNEKVGNYLLWYSDKWYAFDDKKNPIKLDGGKLLAYNSNHDIPIYNFKTENIDDMEVVKQMLEENNLDRDSKFTASYKVVFDFDGDEEEETFYLVTNVFPSDFHPEKIFSLVFMVDKDDIYPIYTDISNNNGYNGCKPYFNTFLDINNDKKYEMVLSCSKYSVSNTIDMLYEFVDKEFKIKISNQ